MCPPIASLDNFKLLRLVLRLLLPENTNVGVGAKPGLVVEGAPRRIEDIYAFEVVELEELGAEELQVVRLECNGAERHDKFKSIADSQS